MRIFKNMLNLLLDMSFVSRVLASVSRELSDDTEQAWNKAEWVVKKDGGVIMCELKPDPHHYHEMRDRDFRIYDIDFIDRRWTHDEVFDRLLEAYSQERGFRLHGVDEVKPLPGLATYVMEHS
jgi:hypothetical protein